MNLRFLPIAAAAIVAFASPAFAHPKIVTATPAANATVAPTNTVRLTFNERLMPKLSSATLVMTGMPGMATHAEMKMTGVTSAVGADGMSLVLTSARPVSAGTYRVDFVVVASDGHRVTGTHVFSVR